MKLLRVKDWNELFESAKSRTYKIKAQAYMPNKFGLGYCRIMAQADGPAIYGAWCALVCVLSRQPAKRLGYLTDSGRPDGNPLEAIDLATLCRMPVDVFDRMLKTCASKSVGWLVVANVKDTARIPQGHQPDTTRIPHGPSPLPSPLPLPTPEREGSVISATRGGGAAEPPAGAGHADREPPPGQIEDRLENLRKSGSIVDAVQAVKACHEDFRTVPVAAIENTLKGWPAERWAEAIEKLGLDYAGAHLGKPCGRLGNYLAGKPDRNATWKSSIG